MPSFTPNVEFDTLAREWRMKWSEDNERASLVALQDLLSAHLDSIKGIDGVKNVQRIVCTACVDFKVIIALEAEKFGAWSGAEFAPEAAFLEAARAIPGVAQVETQTYTLMTV